MKRDSQIRDSEKITFYGIVGIVVILIILAILKK